MIALKTSKQLKLCVMVNVLQNNNNVPQVIAELTYTEFAVIDVIQFLEKAMKDV